MIHRAGFLAFLAFVTFFAQAGEVNVLLQQSIPAENGVELSANVWLPADIGDKGLPVVMVLTPYISDEAQSRGTWFANRGFVYVSVDRRGRGNSEGVFSPFLKTGLDGIAAVKWIRKQPFCDGRVVMRGGSYRGMTQWQTASEMPGGLQTIVPTASAYPGHDLPSPKGVTMSYIVRWLAFTSGKTRNAQFFADENYWRTKYLKMYKEHIPFNRLDSLAGVPSKIFQEWLEHPIYDDYWAAYNPTSEQYGEMSLPILSITGYYDGDQPGAMRYYREYEAYAAASALSKHYLLIGPWDHAGTRNPTLEMEGLSFPENSVLDMDQLHLDWYNWVLNEGKKPEILKDKVNYYVVGAGEWRHAPNLEALSNDTLALYLSSPDGHSGDPFHSGYLNAQPPKKEESDTLVHDPLELPGAEGYELSTSYTDPVEMMHPNRLIYHSAPLKSDTLMAGVMKTTLYVSTDVPDTDLSATLYVVEPNGKTIFLGQDLVRARYRNGGPEPQFLERGVVEPFVFDQFWFTVRQLPKGSRIRLIIGPLNSPAWQKNYNSGGKPGFETAEDARTANLKFHFSSKYPSSIELPIQK